MLTLYHAAQSRSVRPRWLLEELEVPYQLVRMNLAAGDSRTPEYLRINPNGTVPTLVDDGLAIFESAAICQYLADKYADRGLAPAAGTSERGAYYQWIHYAMSGLEPPAEVIFYHTVLRPEAERIQAVVDEARPKLAKALDVVERALDGREFLVGDRFTVADIMVGSTIGWALMFFTDGARPNVAAYLGRLMSRTAYQRGTGD